MGDPVRKSNNQYPGSPGDIAPRDLGSDGSSQGVQEGLGQSPSSQKDPSLFGEEAPPSTPQVLGSNPWIPQGAPQGLVQSSPLPGPTENSQPTLGPESTRRVEQNAKARPTKNRRRGFSFTLLIFGAIGLMAFGAGASLAYFVLSGALDLDHSWIKENLNVIKNLLKDWRK